jgi:Glycosyltransferase family 87
MPSTRSPIALAPRELLVACTAILFVFAIGVGLRAVGWKWAGGASWETGGDFAAFYVAGRTLDRYDAASLYDRDLQDVVYRDVVPGAAALHRTFAYPPYIAALFRPLAHLQLRVALIIFMIATLLAFLAALVILTRQFGPHAADERALAIAAGLSFFPFLGYTWLGAQISTLGFFAIAWALVEEDRGHPILSGSALSLCLYKPTLLLLILPMLLVTGRLRHLAGFAGGAALQASLWLAAGGVGSIRAFLDEIRWTMERTTTTGQVFNPYRYVDVNAFFRLLPFGRSPAGGVVVAILAGTAAAALVRAWVRSRRADRSTRLFVWAATIAWTLVLNIYTPFYDTVLVVAAAVIATAAVRARGWYGWNRLAPALMCVYAAPWIAEISAKIVQVQIDTLVLAGLGVLLLAESGRSVASDDRTAVSSSNVPQL